MKKDFHVGKLIRLWVDKAGIPVTEFAKGIDKVRSNVYNIFEREDVSTDILRKASYLLGHNIFQDLADEYDALYDKKEDVDSDLKAVAQFFKIVPVVLREMCRGIPKLFLMRMANM